MTKFCLLETGAGKAVDIDAIRDQELDPWSIYIMKIGTVTGKVTLSVPKFFW